MGGTSRGLSTGNRAVLVFEPVPEKLIGGCGCRWRKFRVGRRNAVRERAVSNERAHWGDRNLK